MVPIKSPQATLKAFKFNPCISVQIKDLGLEAGALGDNGQFILTGVPFQSAYNDILNGIGIYKFKGLPIEEFQNTLVTTYSNAFIVWAPSDSPQGFSLLSKSD
jgi:hypothetical protein